MWAPITSRAGDSEASTQPPSRRPRQSGRKPFGSRTPIIRSLSASTRVKAPRRRGSTSASAASKASPGSMSVRDTSSRASSSATRSLSEVTVPGSIPASVASCAVLTRLPLWPRANSKWSAPRYTGWALRQVLDPVVEYRVWPMARSPVRAARVRSSKTFDTRPMSLTTVRASPSLTAMPADSWPRC